MLIALKKAFFDVFKSNICGLLWATVFITVLLFGLLFFGFSELARYWQIKDMPSVSIIINAVGVLAFFVLALFLFPAVATFVAGFFMDTAVERLESEHKNLPLRTVPLSESIKMSGVAMTKSVLTSSFLVPISFIPIFTLITPILFYYLNGRLFAREYFFTVALRYQDYEKSEKMFKDHQKYWTIAGVIIVFLMTIPLINIISPLVAVAFMQNLFLEKQK